MGIAGDYWLGFQLTVMPWRGAERTLRGSLFGTRSPEGPLTRLTIGGAGEIERRWLIASGPQPAAWVGEGKEVRRLAPAETLAPVAETDLSIFDLQMPFIYWTDFVYEGVARVRGRPAHRILLYPPTGGAAAGAALTAVRIFVDTQFQALLQAEMLGGNGELEKTITVLDLKKSGEQWLLKSIDLRNHRTRAKTRFAVTAAALNLQLPAGTFAPDRLWAEPPELPAATVERF